MAGAKASAHVSEPVLLTAFAGLMLLVGVVMVVRQLGDRRLPGAEERPRRSLDDPILTFSPTFACQCPRALKLLVTATVVGLLTGFLGVGGGFLVVPALMLVFAFPIEVAAGTSLVVIAVTSAAALAVRAGVGVQPDWSLVVLLTVAASVGGVAGAWLSGRVDRDRLSWAFALLVLGVAGYTAARAFPQLI